MSEVGSCRLAVAIALISSGTGPWMETGASLLDLDLEVWVPLCP